MNVNDDAGDDSKVRPELRKVLMTEFTKTSFTSCAMKTTSFLTDHSEKSYSHLHRTGELHKLGVFSPHVAGRQRRGAEQAPVDTEDLWRCKSRLVSQNVSVGSEGRKRRGCG